MSHRKSAHCKYCLKNARENDSLRQELSQLRQHLVSMDTQRQEVMLQLQTLQSAMQYALLAMRAGSQRGAITALESAMSG
jgi:hypothetical protein